MSVVATSSRGRAVARRAVFRWCVRIAVRERRQHALVVGLLTLSVGSAVAASCVVAAVAPAGANATFGAASHRFTLDDADPAVVERTAGAAHQWFGTVEVIRRGQVAVAGRGDLIEVRVQDPQAPLGAPMLALRAGRYPVAARELAVTEALAAQLGVDVGSSLSVDTGVPMQVVGLVENPNSLSDEFLVASPRFGDGAPSVTILADADDARAMSFLSGEGSPLVGASRATVAGPALVAVLGVTEVALLLVSLIAAAGFVASAQRRQRQLGMLAAIGATVKQLGLVTLSAGMLIGLLAALVGAALGLVTWLAAASAVGEHAGMRVDRSAVPWGVVGLIVLLTLATTTSAAWWPARLVVRVPVTAALAGRRPRPRTTRVSVPVAFGLLGGGLLALSVAGDVTDPSRDGIAIRSVLLVVAGGGATVAGVLMLCPAAIRLLAARAGGLTLPVRLALRDLARYQSRSAAALGAISLGLGIPLAVVVGTASVQASAGNGNLSSRQVVLSVGVVTDAVLAPTSEATLAERELVVDRLAGDLGGAQVTELRVVVDPRLEVSPLGVEAVRADREGVDLDGAPVFVATDGLLDAMALSPPAGFTLVTAETGPIAYGGVIDPVTGRHPPQPVTDAVIVGRGFTSLPASVLAARVVEERGWSTMNAGWLIIAPEPLTDDQLSAVRSAAIGAGLRAETRDHQLGLLRLRHGATVVGMALALGILALMVGVLRSETARDLATLTTTGATSRVRRAIGASTASALAGLAVVFAIVAVYAAMAAARGSVPALPVPNIAGIALGVPGVAWLVGYLASGREPELLGLGD